MESRFDIITYHQKYQQQSIDLIVNIQKTEFAVDITAEDQPDLKDVKAYYQSGSGNFWLAIKDNEVLGTIALSDIGNRQVALRKMFVKKGHRGAPLFIGQKLMDTAIDWCQQHKIQHIFLGTVPSYHAAHRFYEKNDFDKISTSQLPKTFSIMAVDKYFYHLDVTKTTK